MCIGLYMVMYMHNVTMCTSVHVRAKIMTSVQICTDGARTCTALHGYFCWPPRSANVYYLLRERNCVLIAAI